MRQTIAALLCVLAISAVQATAPPHVLSYVRLENIVVAPDEAVKLVVTPGQLNKSGEWVTVEWTGVSKPSEKDDWIGVYSLDSDKNFTATAPVKYLLSSKSSGWKSGAGSVRFRLVNMRAPYFFTFMRKGFDTPEVVAQSSPVEFADYNEPLQPHLAITPTENTLALTWVSLSHAAPTVYWGTESGAYPYSAAANSTTYAADHMCGAPATTSGWRDPGWIHTASLSNLVTGQQYFYYFGDQDSWSDEFNFTYRGSSESLRILAWGDMGTAYDDGGLDIIHEEMDPSLKTTANALSVIDNTDLILHIGDISYARGFASDWESFFHIITPIASRVPYMVGAGNHERDFPASGSVYAGEDSGGECGVAYNMRFPYCSGAVLDKNKLKRDSEWYSFNYGVVHFLVMGTEHDFSESSAQLAFLEADLASVDRTQTPWIIFLGHRPMYIDSTNNDEPAGDQPVARALRASVEPLLVKYRVDLAFWGHHHSYQRTCPVNNQTCAKDGDTFPTHVVIGMAGAGLSQNIEDKPPHWIKYVNDQVHGFSQLEVNRTNLHFHFHDEDGNKLDELRLTQSL